MLQSCTVYKSTTITLNQAVQTESRVNVKTTSGKHLIFQRISAENGKYYGIKKAKGELTKVPLSQEYIVSIKEKDEASSIFGTIVLSAILGAAILHW